jgi:hypothetical protein
MHLTRWYPDMFVLVFSISGGVEEGHGSCSNMTWDEAKPKTMIVIARQTLRIARSHRADLAPALWKDMPFAPLSSLSEDQGTLRPEV